jgi:hypothetical protein
VISLVRQHWATSGSSRCSCSSQTKYHVVVASSPVSAEIEEWIACKRFRCRVARRRHLEANLNLRYANSTLEITEAV